MTEQEDLEQWEVLKGHFMETSVRWEGALTMMAHEYQATGCDCAVCSEAVGGKKDD